MGLGNIRSHVIALAWLAVTVAATPGAAAQELYGSIVGTVQDGSGARIPGATITIVNRDNNLTMTAVSNESGAYTFTNVLPGPYDVKVSLQGFKEFVQQNVPVTDGLDQPRRGQAGSRRAHRVGHGAVGSPAAQDRQGRHRLRILVQGNRGSAAAGVPQLPEPARPRARLDAVGIPERRDRHAGAGAVDHRERHQSQQQQHAGGRRDQQLHLAAASCAVCRAGRDHRLGQRDDRQLLGRSGPGGRSRGHRHHQVGHQSALGIGLRVLHRPEPARAHLVGQAEQHAEAPLQSPHRRRHARRADRPEQGLLLRRVRRAVPQHRRGVDQRRAHREDAPRRLQRGAQQQRIAAADLRSAHRRQRGARARALCQQHHSCRSHQLDRAADSTSSIRCPTARATRTTISRSSSAPSTATSTTSRSTGTAAPVIRSGERSGSWTPA